MVLEKFWELGGGILQVSRLGVETLKNEVFLTKKAVRSWIKRLVANLSETHIFSSKIVGNVSLRLYYLEAVIRFWLTITPLYA